MVLSPVDSSMPGFFMGYKYVILSRGYTFLPQKFQVKHLKSSKQIAPKVPSEMPQFNKVIFLSNLFTVYFLLPKSKYYELFKALKRLFVICNIDACPLACLKN